MPGWKSAKLEVKDKLWSYKLEGKVNKVILESLAMQKSQEETAYFLLLFS